MGSFYEYEVEWYCVDDQQMRVSHGVTFAASLSDALNNISMYYGEKAIDRIELLTIEDETCYDFNDECSLHNFKLQYRGRQDDK